MSNFDTPWFVEGALHQASIARNITWTLMNGTEGILSAEDCAVTEKAVPGSSVAVAPGTVAVLANGLTDEMYVGRLPVADSVTIAATDSTGGRSDLIVARVVNPVFETVPADWPAIDPEDGPFLQTYVFSGVGPTVTTPQEVDPDCSAIALARVDVPASTGTITQAMITDLRREARGVKVLTAPTGSEVPPGTPDGTLFVEYTP